MNYKLLSITLLCLLSYTSAGVMHSHSTDIHKERVEDGAYSPRDQEHYDEFGVHQSQFDHEAILGSHKEVAEYDQLPPEEAKKRLLILLKKMDLNGDEKITRKELKAWILRSFKMLSEEEANDRLEDVDEDNDGLVTWKEFLSDAYGFDDNDPSKSINDPDYLLNDDKMLWRKADVNKDGVLDSKEWLAFTHPEEHPAMLPILLEQTLRDKDDNGDKAISFEEFIGKRAQDHDKEWLAAEKEKFDRDLDKNGDHKLTGNEILSWAVPSNAEIATEEVDHLFASSDDDVDNVLSFSEILEHQDVFVGSEATDYGEHLHNIHHFQDEL